MKGLKTIKNNKVVISNIIAAFGIKGLGMVINLFSMPLYIDYFKNNTILGLWFTLLTVVNWVLSFDVGIGNGLRNHLTEALTNKDYSKSKQLTSSAIVSLGTITVIFSVLFFLFIPLIDWNSMFNITACIVSKDLLVKCIIITTAGIMISFFLNISRGILFALQLSSVVNLMQLMTSVLLVGYLYVSPIYDSLEEKILTLSFAYAIIINIPSILVLLFVFLFTEMKYCIPSFRTVDLESIKSVLGLGLSFFVVQIMYMVITVTNEWFISKFFSPEYCVDYQIYFRLFALIGSLIMLAMSPLWSAITKAYTQKRYDWIRKLYRTLNFLAVASMLFECFFVIFLQPIINIWLGERAIEVNYLTASYFLFYGVVMIWVAIQSTIVSGLGILKTQLCFYLFAALFKIIVIIVISKYSEDWSLVVLVTALGLLPFCIFQPLEVRNQLIKLQSNNY